MTYGEPLNYMTGRSCLRKFEPGTVEGGERWV